MKTRFDTRTNAKEEWLTPLWVLKELEEFDLDPCAPLNRPWDIAKHHFTINDDGLNKQWFGRVFCNPPYGNQTGKWMKKMAEHNNGIALIFARTETVMFWDYIWKCASSLLFIKGRLKFNNPDGTVGKSSAGAPSVLVAYGFDNTICLKHCNINGAFVSNICPKENIVNFQNNNQQLKLDIRNDKR